MKKIKSSVKIVAMLLALCIIFGSCPNVFAANTANAPYGYTYDDAATGRTMYKYFNYVKSSYSATRVFYSRGNTVYQSNGTVVTNLSAGPGSQYNGFALGELFCYITSNGEVISVDKNNKVTILIPSGAISFSYNADELITIVKTTSGNKYISNLADAPETDDNTVSVITNKSANRVEIFTNSAGEMVYNAFKNNKLALSIVTSKNGQKVLNATDKVRLSDTVKGAKFMGLDTFYNVYLYELNGTVYRFKNGNWYSAERIKLNSTFKSFKTDDNGFISQIVTAKDTFTIKQLTTSNKWKAKKTYVVTKDNYCTLYIKGTTKSYTLLLVNGILRLNGKKVATNVSKFGFISAKKLGYIRKGVTFTSKISKPKNSSKFCSNSNNFKKSKIGLIKKVVLKNGKSQKIY